MNCVSTCLNHDAGIVELHLGFRSQMKCHVTSFFSREDTFIQSFADSELWREVGKVCSYRKFKMNCLYRAYNGMMQLRLLLPVSHTKTLHQYKQKESLQRSEISNGTAADTDPRSVQGPHLTNTTEAQWTGTNNLLQWVVSSFCPSHPFLTGHLLG